MDAAAADAPSSCYPSVHNQVEQSEQGHCAPSCRTAAVPARRPRLPAEAASAAHASQAFNTMSKSGAKASSHHSRDSWPVLVYRLRSGCAWEVFAGVESTAGKGKPTMKSGNEDELTASPKKGCIEVRKMRLRVRLFDAASKSTDVAKQRDIQCDLDGWDDHALVVRRKNTVLVTTRRGMG